jgi:hypothetical protein
MLLSEILRKLSLHFIQINGPFFSYQLSQSEVKSFISKILINFCSWNTNQVNHFSFELRVILETEKNIFQKYVLFIKINLIPTIVVALEF